MGSSNSKFSQNDITSQKDKVFLVTGANTGLGLETCRVLASKGATVVMAYRDEAKSKKAVGEVREIAANNEGTVHTIVLDLGDLSKVKSGADDFLALNLPLHCLINNAGVMMCPKGKTKDGFETQFGVNHLGHFAFTAHLFDKLAATAQVENITAENPVRIINLTSSYHSKGPKEGILFENIDWSAAFPKYTPGLAYGHSKFANVVFTKELNDKLKHEFKGKIQTFAVHPGFVDTELTRHVEKVNSKFVVDIYKFFNRALNVRQGALTQLYCAVSPEVVENKLSGEYFVPIAKHSSLDKNAPKITKEMQGDLWTLSEKMTGVEFNIRNK